MLLSENDRRNSAVIALAGVLDGVWLTCAGSYAQEQKSKSASHYAQSATSLPLLAAREWKLFRSSTFHSRPTPIPPGTIRGLRSPADR
jgi:uncharacterized membrane protein (UPF0136 family)